MADVSLSPTSLVVAGAIVNSSNPLPAHVVAAGAGGTDVSLNPKSLVVNGAIVSTTNPLPLTLS